MHAKSEVMELAITRTVARTGFCKELSAEKQNEYLGITRDKFMPTIDNLYFSVFIYGDGYPETMYKLNDLLETLLEKKEEVKTTHKPVPYAHGLLVTLKNASKRYNICLTETDLYDIFIMPGNLPNNRTNRIHVQLRAFGLWTRGLDEILEEAYAKVELILAEYGLKIAKAQENRVDYCYHTNIVSSINQIFTKAKIKKIHTPLQSGISTFDIVKREDGTTFEHNYYKFGNATSNNWLVRFYDKVKEVIDMGYKSFFFKMWQDNGLISYYDKWCMEYAFPYKNVDYLNKARIAFYAKHGTDPARLEKYNKALTNPNKSLADYKSLADEFMPPTTAVINIEYQTMRKFYDKSDNFINNFPLMERTSHPMLKRIYQVIDNREVFLNYLHDKGFSFQDGENEDGTPKYVGWWERLRNTKLGGIKANEKLLRDYSYAMDKTAVVRQAIGKVASISAYDDRAETDELDDFMYMVSHLTDNQAHEMDKLLLVNTDGEIITSLKSTLLSDYETNKAKKLMYLKNRKKPNNDTTETPPPEPELEIKDFDFLCEVMDLKEVDFPELPEEWRQAQ